MIVRGVVCALVAMCIPPAQAAFETMRDVQGSAPAYDPVAATGLFWHVNPAFAVLGPAQVVARVARPYGLESLNTGSAGLILTPGRGAFALAIASLGSAALYRELDLSIAAAYTVGGTVSVGFAGHYLEIRTGPRFGPLAFGAVDAGVVWSPGRSWFICASATDMGTPSLYGRQVVSPRFQAGVSWRYSDQLSLRAGLTTRDGYRHASFGETLRLSHALVLAAELQSGPIRLGVVVTLRLGGLLISIGYRDHPDLGGDTNAAVGWQFDADSER